MTYNISMKGSVTHFGFDHREWIRPLLAKFYKNFAINAQQDGSLSTEVLGKNWSICVYNRDEKNYLICFDSDDGSGGTPADCKLNIWKLNDALRRYNTNDYIIFKLQYASVSEQRQFYPFKVDVYPLGLMPSDPERVFKLASNVQNVQQDIDVLFVGGRVHAHNKPFVWPKNRNINQWWAGNRTVGYNKLLSIKGKRKDLVIETHDGLLPPDRYYNLVNRSKVCLDFPGTGLGSRKFYEFLVFGKCILALKQQTPCWPLEENVHYSSMGLDYDWNGLEERIDLLLKDEEIRSSLEQNAKSLRPYLTHEYVVDYIAKTIDEHIDAMGMSDFDLIRPRYD